MSLFLRTYCLIGDGESAEGSIWEALSFAGVKKLNNLVAIFDINRLGQSEPTAFQHEMDIYRTRLQSFGFNALVVDGHDVEALCKVREPKGSSCRNLSFFMGKYVLSKEKTKHWVL